MNKIFITTLLFIGLVSCKSEDSTGSKENKAAKNKKAESEKKITKRDRSITPANAYNDIFLDSLEMEKFITVNQLNDTIIRRMRSFYNARNYQYAWFASDGLTEQSRAFWNLQSYYHTVNKGSAENGKALIASMDRLELIEDLKVSAADKNILKTEFLLTQHFIQYVLDNYEDGIVKRKELERFIPLFKSDPLRLADSLLTKKHKDGKYYEDDNTAYKALKGQLQKYYAIAKSGGWQMIPSDKRSLKIGAASPTVFLLKKRLQATGEMGADSTNVFNTSLENAVKTYQTGLGLTPDGIVSETLIKSMNVPAVTRVQQILINLDRMRWMPVPEGNLILVNIPEFVLHVFEGKKKAFQMAVVVGKEGHNTMMFKGDLSQVVFSPYWNLTPTIIKEEIMPAMARDPNYLANHNMEITSSGGGTPVIRQLPGEENSLGKVKFLFPNSFNIYFHDTPAKSLFSKDKRAFSHGCIRLSEPTKMAQYILRNSPEWTPEKINAAMNTGKEQFVKVKNPIPVIITYYTAWVDENGLLNFRDDIYKHDQHIAGKMFMNMPGIEVKTPGKATASLSASARKKNA
ncbi:MAG: L,D-transpeptidase family protein [Ferruginibacter sp.]